MKSQQDRVSIYDIPHEITMFPGIVLNLNVKYYQVFKPKKDGFICEVSLRLNPRAPQYNDIHSLDSQK